MLSQQAQDLLNVYAENRTDVSRPSFDELCMQIAQLFSNRSLDGQTNYGCVLAKDSRIIATGYNSFIRDIDDSVLPNLRGDKGFKYPFMRHSEENALINCAREGISTKGATCYVTGRPCLSCHQQLWQAGISKIVFIDHKAKMLEEQAAQLEIIYHLIGDRMPLVEFFP